MRISAYSEEPLHVGMRQYWRDYDALEAWSLALPHKAWWSDYLRDRGGTSFWHETYFRRGGIETMYVDTGETIGLSRVAAVRTGSRARCSRRDGAPNPTGWRQAGKRELYSVLTERSQESNDESLANIDLGRRTR